MKNGLYTFEELSFYMDKAEKPVMELLKASQEREKLQLDELIKFQNKVAKMQKDLDEWENAALIPCDTCGGGGFNGQGTGYSTVCDGCAGNGGYMGRATPQDLSEMIEKRMSQGATNE